MLLEEIIALGLTGALTALTTTLIVTKGKNTILLLFMILLGACSGWISGMIWVYLTGGLGLTIWALTLPVFITLFFSMIALYHFKEKNVLPRISHETSPLTTILSILLIIILAFALTIPYLPIEGESTPAESTVLPTQLPRQYQNIYFSKTLTTSDVNTLTAQSTSGLMPINIDITKSSVKFPRMAENPDRGDYLAFEVTFTVSQYNWNKPMIGIVVLKDADENGELSEGDQLWPCNLYKYPTNSGTDWRCYVWWTSDGGTYATYWITGDDGYAYLLPSFHGKISSPSHNEQGQTLDNTPEGFVCPNDMITINAAGEVEDQMTSWTSIPAGSTATIQGKIYVPDMDEFEGQHLIFVVASDYDYGDLATKTIAFTVGGGGGGKPVVDIDITTWVVAAALIAGTIAGSVAVVIYTPKYL